MNCLFHDDNEDDCQMYTSTNCCEAAMRKVNEYSEIKEGMKLKSISENYQGTVEFINGTLQTDCMGWGFEPISELDLDDILITNK